MRRAEPSPTSPHIARRRRDALPLGSVCRARRGLQAEGLTRFFIDGTADYAGAELRLRSLAPPWNMAVEDLPGALAWGHGACARSFSAGSSVLSLPVWRRRRRRRGHRSAASVRR